ncbi:MAG TPA: ATP-binding protein [Isosphaeraceae bacterium]|nr:ATP-binding protein [Isosphaeraceae bacterium]
MRVYARRNPAPEGLRRGLLRLGVLPVRPHTARLLSAAMPESPGEEDPEPIEDPQIRSVCQLDPGWVLAQQIAGQRSGTLAILAERPWWPRAVSTGPLAEVMGRLWRHGVAVSTGARWLAREAGDPDPEVVARAGLLCDLGCWAVAAVEPEWLLSWVRQEDPRRRRQQECDDLGSDLHDLGRRMAERWRCDPLVVDAAWLGAEGRGGLTAAAERPGRLAFIQQAYRWAEQTPWSLSQASSEGPPSDPRLRILMAEVQARCSTPFVDGDATSHEERLTRQTARLRRQLIALRLVRDRSDRFLQMLADSPPGESPQEWADRAARTWCAEPEVSAARVVWHGAERPAVPEGSDPGRQRGDDGADPPVQPGEDPRPPTLVLPLGARGEPCGSIQLWCAPGTPDPGQQLAATAPCAAWGAWAALLADRARLERRLQAVVASCRQLRETQEVRLRQGKLDALAEFAAGAGHELNNPLAVIVGRAQLLLTRTTDSEVARSLQIILSQAQRTHRILRDLMFIARPPAPRNRLCRPSESLRSLLPEFERQCAARGIQLVYELDEPPASTWADPEALRHLAEILLRNALQAAPAGGRIHIQSVRHRDELVWSFSDTGRGILPAEAAHLFDPFFCGRQAGRGLGLGLPRAARIVDLAGGQLRWTSHPGHETTFQVHLPLVPRPESASQAIPASQPVGPGQRGPDGPRPESASQAIPASQDPTGHDEGLLKR